MMKSLYCFFILVFLFLSCEHSLVISEFDSSKEYISEEKNLSRDNFENGIEIIEHEKCVTENKRKHISITKDFLNFSKTKNSYVHIANILPSKKGAFLIVANIKGEATLLKKSFRATDDVDILLIAFHPEQGILWSRVLEGKGIQTTGDAAIHPDGSFWITGAYTHDWEIDHVKFLSTPRFMNRPKAQAFVLHFEPSGKALWGHSYEEENEFASNAHQISYTQQKSISIVRTVMVGGAHEIKTFLDQIDERGLRVHKKQLSYKKLPGWGPETDIHALVRAQGSQYSSFTETSDVIKEIPKIYMSPSYKDNLLILVESTTSSWKLSSINPLTFKERWSKSIRVENPPNSSQENNIYGGLLSHSDQIVTIALEYQGNLLVEQQLFSSEDHNLPMKYLGFYSFSIETGELIKARRWLAGDSPVIGMQQRNDGTLVLWGTSKGFMELDTKKTYSLAEKKNDIYNPKMYVGRYDEKNSFNIITDLPH